MLFTSLSPRRKISPIPPHHHQRGTLPSTISAASTRPTAAATHHIDPRPPPPPSAPPNSPCEHRHLHFHPRPPPKRDSLRQLLGIMSSGGENKEPMNEQMIVNMYGAMRSEINQLHSKITELEMEVSEHSLVMGAIQPLDPSRRCYRMIGGVLVERTIREVLPAVQRNKEGLEEVIARLNEALERKKKEITDFEVKHKIKIKRADGSAAEQDGALKEGSAQGVLVGPAGEKQN